MNTKKKRKTKGNLNNQLMPTLAGKRVPRLALQLQLSLSLNSLLSKITTCNNIKQVTTTGFPLSLTLQLTPPTLPPNYAELRMWYIVPQKMKWTIGESPTNPNKH
jgi:hypothetical protein